MLITRLQAQSWEHRGKGVSDCRKVAGWRDRFLSASVIVALVLASWIIPLLVSLLPPPQMSYFLLISRIHECAWYIVSAQLMLLNK